jgi:ribonuclease HIII
MKKEKQIVFRVDEKELELITMRSKDFNFRSISEYCRFIALNTQQIQIYTGTTLLKYASGGN